MTKEEFIQLIETHKKLIYKICHTYCKDAESRKDLEQEIIIQLWGAMKKYNGNVKISTYMYKIGLNTAISHYRKSKKWRISPINESILSTPDENNFHLDEQVKFLYQCIQELNKIDKAIILLHLEEHNYQEIADIIGITKTNVATKLNRIKKKLKNCLILKNEL